MRRTRSLGAALVVLTTTLTACSDPGSSEDAAPPPSATSEATDPASTSETPEVTETPEPTATPEPQAQDDFSDPAECLVGSFALDREAWTEGLSEAIAAIGTDRVSVENTGDLEFEFRADGTYVLTASQHRTLSTGSGPGGDVQWVMTFDGVEAGTWATEEGPAGGATATTLTAGPEGRLAADNEISIDGSPLPADAIPVDGTPWSDTLSTTCDADQVTASSIDDPAAPDVVLRRVG